MKRYLVVIRNIDEVHKWFNFFVDLLSANPESYCTDRSAQIQTDAFVLDIVTEQKSSCGTRTNGYLYLGDNQTFENIILKPGVIPKSDDE